MQSCEQQLAASETQRLFFVIILTKFRIPQQQLIHIMVKELNCGASSSVRWLLVKILISSVLG